MATDPAPVVDSVDAIAQGLGRSAATLRAKVASDVDAANPTLEYDPTTGQRLYETAPVPVTRLMSSPLTPSSPYASGPNGERVVIRGWGATALSSYDPGVSTVGKQQGLDYTALHGEPVYAVADGIVRWVGYQSKNPSENALVPGIHSNDAKEQILDGTEQVIATVADQTIGFGGIFVWIAHSGDFEGYQTEYYQLASVAVENGATVSEGDIIGHLGGTGGANGWFHKDYFLHFQIAFTSGATRALVCPTSLVPNYWPGHTDSTGGGFGFNVVMPAVAATGVQVAAAQAALMLTTINRATTMQNKDIADLKQDQSDHADRADQTLGVHQTAIYAATAAFQGAPPRVTNPMTFDFAAGVWSDGRPV